MKHLKILLLAVDPDYDCGCEGKRTHVCVHLAGDDKAVQHAESVHDLSCGQVAGLDVGADARMDGTLGLENGRVASGSQGPF